jgi:hypothetical protein
MLLDLVATHLHRELKSGRNRPLLFGYPNRQGNHIGDFVVKARLADLSNDQIERIFSNVPGEWRHSDMQTISTHLQFFRENSLGFGRQLLEVLT